MKYFLLALMFVIMSSAFAEQTPQTILKSEGFVLVTKQNGKEIYYRPKEVSRSDGIAYYSTTIFYTKNINGQLKYSLKSEYKALGCKEKRVFVTGVHTVPYIGKASFKNNVTKSLKDSNFKSLNTLDSIMYSKVCK